MKENKNKTLVLGLGNTLLGDDGVGIHVARRIAALRNEGPCFDVVEASLGGAALLEAIAGYDTLILIDAITTGEKHPAGAIHELALDDLGKTVKPYASHALDLKTTLRLGAELGYNMPGTVRIYAIEIEQRFEFKEELSAQAEKAVQEVVRRVIREPGVSHKEKP
jgi:hydrogenase maturation protease